MLGAIIGDIVGSRFERNNIKTKDFALFSEDCHMTDDSIMTLAIAQALIDCEGDVVRAVDAAVKSMRTLGRAYPHCGFGHAFRKWIYFPRPKPYHSYGNGAAMRVSPCAYVARSFEEAIALSRAVTEVTHNHPEGIKGAEAVTVAIYVARTGTSKADIREYIHRHYYSMRFSIDGIRNIYEFDASCQGSVPQAIKAFVEAESFEDAIRNAVSIGGDSDTIAAIAGSIAAPYFGIPKQLRTDAMTFMDDRTRGILQQFEQRYDTTASDERA